MISSIVKDREDIKIKDSLIRMIAHIITQRMFGRAIKTGEKLKTGEGEEERRLSVLLQKKITINIF
jgi:hypothetical protein